MDAWMVAISRSPQTRVLPLPVIHTNSLADTQVLASNLFSKRLWEPIYKSWNFKKTSWKIQESKWRTISRTLLEKQEPSGALVWNFSSKIRHQNSRDEHTTKNEFLGHTYSRFFASSNSHTQLALLSLSLRVSSKLSPFSLLRICDFCGVFKESHSSN